MRRRTPAGPSAAAVTIALGLGLVGAFGVGPASAHNSVVSTTPEAGETLTELPEAFEIRTNDALLDLGGGDGFAFLVQDADGLYYGDGCVRIDGPSMFTTPSLGEPGDYTVTWQVVSADGHTVSDSYTFTWEPEGRSEPATGSADRPGCGEASAPDPGTDPDRGAGEDADGDPGIPADVWWIAGAAAALIVAIALALFLGRRAS